jgi:uncharacterized RDD family membrane protein YckC
MSESPAASAAAVYPSVWRRLAAMIYEAFLALANLIVAGFLSGAATHKFEGAAKSLFGLLLVLVLGAYFVLCWRRGSQTLAMKAWRLRVVEASGEKLSLRRAVLRYVYAALSIGLGVVGAFLLRQNAHEWHTWALLAPACITVLWALVDRDKQFLHDRLAGTRLVLR